MLNTLLIFFKVNTFSNVLLLFSVLFSKLLNHFNKLKDKVKKVF